MPKYFFSLRGDDVHRNVGGLDLPTIAAARLEAIRFGAEMLRQDPDLIWDGQDFRVLVTDPNGALCVTVVMLAIDANDV